MKERGILFSAPMVRALLDGSKTQTRRVANTGLYAIDVRIHGAETAARELAALVTKCPYGQPGDRLWVRETWAQPAALDPGPTVYRADYPACVPRGYTNVPPADEIRWKPSIHMFRKDSRILLEIVGVRVERLQDISEADAIAEGVEPHEIGQFAMYGKNAEERAVMRREAAVGPYRGLWESINGGGSWDANPWVWVVEFKRIDASRAAA